MMKNNIIKISAAICLSLVAVVGLAQISDSSSNKNEDDKKVEKRIEVVEENGEITVTVTITEDGKTTTEIYKGDEAREFLKQENSGKGNHFFSDDMDIEINAEDMNFEWIEEMDFEGKSEEEIKAMLDEHMKEMKNDMSFFHYDVKKLDSMCSHNIRVIAGEDGESSVFIVNGDEISVDEYVEEGEVKTKVVVIRTNDDANYEVENKDGKTHIYTRTVVIERIVKLEDIENEKGQPELEITELEMFPNPNNGQFKLKFNVEDNKPTKVLVTDLNGKEVFEKTVKGSGEHNIDLDLSENESGVYLLTLNQNNKVESKKIIIQ